MRHIVRHHVRHGRTRRLLFKFTLFVLSVYIGFVWMAAQSLFTGIGNDDALEGGEAVLDAEEESNAAPLETTETRCAICFFGLPRSFAAMVLPSMMRNVFMRNAKYGCDYFIHFYQKEEEKAGRAGRGGQLNPEEVLLMKAKIKSAAKRTMLKVNPNPAVVFVNDTEADFWEKRGEQVEKYRTTKGEDGQYIYYPWKAKTYHYPESLDNIVKQWCVNLLLFYMYLIMPLLIVDIKNLISVKTSSPFFQAQH